MGWWSIFRGHIDDSVDNRSQVWLRGRGSGWDWGGRKRFHRRVRDMELLRRVWKTRRRDWGLWGRRREKWSRNKRGRGWRNTHWCGSDCKGKACMIQCTRHVLARGDPK